MTASRCELLIFYIQGLDCNGHGTHCAGTVAGDSYGVAKGCQVYGVKVLNCFGSGYTSDIVSGTSPWQQRHLNYVLLNRRTVFQKCIIFIALQNCGTCNEMRFQS